MDDLNPCLALISEVRRSLESGESPRLALRRFSEGTDPFAKQCARWLLLRDKGGDPSAVVRELRSPYRRTLMILLDRGLCGEPIAPALRDFEAETLDACRGEMERHLALLPLKLLLPLLALIFPALMLLMFGPLLDSLISGLSTM